MVENRPAQKTQIGADAKSAIQRRNELRSIDAFGLVIRKIAVLQYKFKGLKRGITASETLAGNGGPTDNTASCVFARVALAYPVVAFSPVRYFVALDRLYPFDVELLRRFFQPSANVTSSAFCSVMIFCIASR